MCSALPPPDLPPVDSHTVATRGIWSCCCLMLHVHRLCCFLDLRSDGGRQGSCIGYELVPSRAEPECMTV